MERGAWRPSGTCYREGTEHHCRSDEMGWVDSLSGKPRGGADSHDESQVVIETHHEMSIEATVLGTGFPSATIALAAKMLPAAPRRGESDSGESAHGDPEGLTSAEAPAKTSNRRPVYV